MLYYIKKQHNLDNIKIVIKMMTTETMWSVVNLLASKANLLGLNIAQSCSLITTDSWIHSG